MLFIISVVFAALLSTQSAPLPQAKAITCTAINKVCKNINPGTTGVLDICVPIANVCPTPCATGYIWNDVLYSCHPVVETVPSAAELTGLKPTNSKCYTNAGYDWCDTSYQCYREYEYTCEAADAQCAYKK